MIDGMWLKTVRLNNVRSFHDSGTIEFSSGINLLVGPNNAGKSTILRSVALLQPPENRGNYLQEFFSRGLRVGAELAEVRLGLEDLNINAIQIRKEVRDQMKLHAVGAVPTILYSGSAANSGLILEIDKIKAPVGVAICNQREPTNFIYPYFSRRKPTNFNLQINPQSESIIEETFDQIPSKIDRLANRDFRHHDTFRKICGDVLGLKISTASWQSGKQAGLMLPEGFIPVDQMGEGTINLLALMSHLCVASGKLFIIEEIENDIHPKALKKLLEFIIEISPNNQFLISTHSNIVMRYLGAVPKAKVFSVEMHLDQQTGIPTSDCRLVTEDPTERLTLLESLGYEPFDFYLWKAFLLLEESTAELIINKLLVPWFVPALATRLKTISAGGVSKVEPTFDDFWRLFLFIHSSPQYKERAWVAVDGNSDGQQVISNLKRKFTAWPDGHFKAFTAENFENYYPSAFQTRASEVLEQPHGQAKMNAKGDLAKEVVKWALENPEKGQEEFQERAKEIIDFLRQIAAKLV